MLFRSYRREIDALQLAVVVSAVGSLWGWAFATEGQVPWWTYFVVTFVSASLVAYWVMGGRQVLGEIPNLLSTDRSSAVSEEMQHLKDLAAYRREFLANVSHELKTSVFIVQGFLDALQDERKTLSKKQRRLLAQARSNLEQLAQLVEDVLTLSLMESGAIRMRPVRFCIRKALLAVARRFSKG